MWNKCDNKNSVILEEDLAKYSVIFSDTTDVLCVSSINVSENKKENFVTRFDSGKSREQIMEAEHRLSKWEGELETSDRDICEIFRDEENLESKVHYTLERHLDFWIETGASDFSVSVIRNGYVPQLVDKVPRYVEPNNRSYKEEVYIALTC